MRPGKEPLPFINAMRFITDHFDDVRALLYLAPSLVLGVGHGLGPFHFRPSDLSDQNRDDLGADLYRSLLLGLSAALSHLLLLWIIASLSSHFGSHWQAGTFLPWFRLFASALTLVMAVWVLRRTLVLCKEPDSNLAGKRGALSNMNRSDDSASLSEPILFGAVSGLLPCPHTFNIITTHLQSGRLTLGLGVVMSYSLGLALAMSLLDYIAARAASRNSLFVRVIPAFRVSASLISCVILVMLACSMAVQGWRGLNQA